MRNRRPKTVGKTHNRYSAAWVYIAQSLITCVEVLRLGLRDAHATLRHRANHQE